MKPGAVLLDVGDADALAWKNTDGSIVTVVHNLGEQPSETVLAIDGGSWRCSVPARGWATVIQKP
jgi:hypothetical protein